MNCSRCQGFLVPERLYDFLNAVPHIDVWRCTNCGDITDKVILTNRQATEASVIFPKMNQAA